MCLSLSIGILGQVWYLIDSIPDLCTLTYFVTSRSFLSIMIVIDENKCNTSFVCDKTAAAQTSQDLRQYSFILTFQLRQSKEEENGDNTGAIVGAVIGALVALSLVAAGVVYYIK